MLTVSYFNLVTRFTLEMELIGEIVDSMHSYVSQYTKSVLLTMAYKTGVSNFEEALAADKINFYTVQQNSKLSDFG